LNTLEIIIKQIIELKRQRKMTEFNENMLRQYRLMSMQSFTNVNDNKHDVELWYSQFESWIKLQGFTQPSEYHDYCLSKVQGTGAKNIKAAVITDFLGNKEYPTLEEMKEILLKTYKLRKSPEDIINELKARKINRNDDIKEFNKKYMEIYNKLDDKSKLRVFPSDYLDTIINKVSVWRSVKSEIKDKEVNLIDVMETAEFYDKLENELRLKTQINSNNYTNKNNKNLSYNKNSNAHNNNSTNPFHNINQSSQNNFNNKPKISFCKFCHERGHTISDCHGYFNYLKYQEEMTNNNNFHNFNNNFNNFNNNPNNKFNNNMNNNNYNNYNFVKIR